MSSEYIDHFKLWESSFDGQEMLDVPADPLDEIVSQSFDPIQCADDLNKYAFGNPAEARSSIMRRGLSKLGYAFYGPYLGKELTVIADQAFGIPETNESRRKRNIDYASRYTTRVIALGNLATFRTNHYTNDTTGEKKTLITLCLSDPYLLDARNQIVKNHKLPDYLMIPIPNLLSYQFKDLDL